VSPALAVLAAALLVAAAAFQAALAAGAPWGAAAYGGRAARSDGRLPAGYRAASLVTVVVLLAIGALLLVRGGVLASAAADAPAVRVAVWVVAGLLALNTLGNLAGRHPVERWGMGAATAVLTVLAVLLALG
jgi:hypothetical protein